MLRSENYLYKMRKYCSYQERCRYDVCLKLSAWKLNKQMKEKIIRQLVEEDFINHSRYTDNYVKGKLRNNKWGRIKIRYMLHGKQIERELVDSALSEINEEEYLAILEGLVKNRLSQGKNLNDDKDKASIIRYLKTRGFERELIYQEINKHQ